MSEPTPNDSFYLGMLLGEGVVLGLSIQPVECPVVPFQLRHLSDRHDVTERHCPC